MRECEVLIILRNKHPLGCSQLFVTFLRDLIMEKGQGEDEKRESREKQENKRHNVNKDSRNTVQLRFCSEKRKGR